MLQLKQHLFGMFFSPKMTSCALHYDVIYHPLPINSQYLKMRGVDSPGIDIVMVFVFFFFENYTENNL